jgi:hypothetical protein
MISERAGRSGSLASSRTGSLAFPDPSLTFVRCRAGLRGLPSRCAPVHPKRGDGSRSMIFSEATPRCRSNRPDRRPASLPELDEQGSSSRRSAKLVRFRPTRQDPRPSSPRRRSGAPSPIAPSSPLHRLRASRRSATPTPKRPLPRSRRTRRRERLRHADRGRRALRRARCQRARPVPSTRFRTSSTASSASRVAGLLHPASGPGVHVVSRFPRPVSRPELRWRFPTCGFTPSEGHLPPAAAPRHRGRCPLAVHLALELPRSLATPLGATLPWRALRGTRFRMSLRGASSARGPTSRPFSASDRQPWLPVAHPGSVLPVLAGPLRSITVSSDRAPYPSMGFVPLRGSRQRAALAAWLDRLRSGSPPRFRSRNRIAGAIREAWPRSPASSRVPISDRAATRHPSQALGSLSPTPRANSWAGRSLFSD